MILDEAINEISKGKLITNKTIWQQSVSGYWWMDVDENIRSENNTCVGNIQKFKKHIETIGGVSPYNPNKWEIYQS